jgi:hypothetical protein
MKTKPAAIASLAFAMLALLLATYAIRCVAGQSSQATFTSAEEASRALTSSELHLGSPTASHSSC